MTVYLLTKDEFGWLEVEADHAQWSFSSSGQTLTAIRTTDA